MCSTKISRWLETLQCDISVRKFGRRTPSHHRFWQQILSIFGERTTISNSKVEKRPRNFYGANVATLGVFQTESVLSRGSASSTVKAFSDKKLYSHSAHTRTYTQTLKSPVVSRHWVSHKSDGLEKRLRIISKTHPPSQDAKSRLYNH